MLRFASGPAVFGLAAGLLLLSAHAVQAQRDSALLSEADSLFRMMDNAGARSMYGQAIERGAVVEGQLGLARVALDERDWAEAARAVDRVLSVDSASVEAHYLKGIALRERARIGTMRQARQLQEAEEAFRWVISHDSLYQDVWAQAGLARLAAGDVDGAVRFAQIQVSQIPDHPRGLVDALRIVRLALDRKGVEEALPWLESMAPEAATFFLGELRRREGAYEAAESSYESVLRDPKHLPRQVVYLALARTAYARDDATLGQEWVERAIREIESAVGAAVVFGDFKYICSNSELAEYRTLRAPEAWRSFFESFWYRREPIPTSGLKVRLAEHYRRLLKAEGEFRYAGARSWQQRPDTRPAFDLPSVYFLNEEFNDKGLVYVRYGEPDDRILTVGGMDDPFLSPVDASANTAWIPNELRLDAERGVVESWRYRGEGLDLHFMRSAAENGWFLVPMVSGVRAFEDREIWGGAYARLARILRDQEMRKDLAFVTPSSVTITGRGQGDSTSTPVSAPMPRGESDTGPAADRHVLLEIQEARDRLIETSRQSVAQVMSTDRHSFSDAYESLEMPFLTAAFRGDDGQTRLELHYALPLGIIYGEEETSLHRIDVEVGFAVHDTLWRPVQASVEVKPMPAVRDRSAAVFDFVTLTVPPDSYQVAVHARPLLRRQLAGYRFGLEVPDFSGYDLTMSDLLPAYEIRPNLAPSRFNRNALYLRVNPFLRAKVSEPLYVYFEIYNLTLGTDERTRFEVDYRLEPLERGGRLRRLFTRGTRPSLSLKFGREGDQVSQVEWAEIDVRKVASGRYTLEVVVLDRTTGRSVSRSRQIELVPE